MPFLEGETLIHPAHGPMRITHIGDRVVRGTTKRYLQLEAALMQLVLSVPEDRAFGTGLRAIASRDRIDELLLILAAPSATHRGPWSKRIKDYQERISTGDVEALCYVVREISHGGAKPRASAEGMLLRRAMATLSIEFSLALQVDELEAKSIIESTVAGTPSRVPISA